MIRWSIRSLLSEGPGLVASYCVVAFAFLLVMFFSAIFSGESDRITAYPSKINADVWVMQRGVGNMHMAMSQMWDWKEQKVREIEGVTDTESILYMNAVFNAGGREWFTYIVGLMEDARFTGPWAMHSGKSVPDKGEVIIPSVLAELTKLKIGNTIKIVDTLFTIVGLSDETFSMANSIVFVSYEDLAEIMSAQGTVSYILAKAANGIDPTELAQRIRSEMDKVNALPQHMFIDNDHHMAVQMGVEIVSMMSVISTVLALVIIVFSTHRLIDRRKRDLAIAKALGFRNRQICVGVLLQVLVLALMGLLLSLVFALLLFPLITLWVPAISLKLTAASVLQIIVITLLVATMSALWPLRQLAAIDPMTVFHKD